MTEMTRSHIKRETAQARAYSQAVITSGGRTIWLAGQVAVEDGAGRTLAGDLNGQVRESFARLGHTLEEAGARLADMVTMTVFITDPRLGDRFVQLRKEIFGDDFPASALITVAGLARPAGDAGRGAGGRGCRLRSPIDPALDGNATICRNPGLQGVPRGRG